ncbi:hypothetical protein Bbelb_317810 [Branchiostoma belcheri]|nr:hypothetical protein Bbelb_317810 [Branchiostoma belcheri]
MKLCLVSGIRKLTRTPEPETPQATTAVKFVPGQRTPETPQATTSVKFVSGPRTPETPQATTSVKFVSGARTPETPQATTSVKFVPGPRTPETPQATTSVKFVPGPRTPETPQATTSVKFVPGQRTPETPQATTSVKFVPGQRTPETPQATTAVKFVPGPRTPETPQATTAVKFVPGPRTPETPQATTSVKFVPGQRTPETPQATTSVKFVPGQRTPETPQATTPPSSSCQDRAPQTGQTHSVVGRIYQPRRADPFDAGRRNQPLARTNQPHRADKFDVTRTYQPRARIFQPWDGAITVSGVSQLLPVTAETPAVRSASSDIGINCSNVIGVSLFRVLPACTKIPHEGKTTIRGNHKGREVAITFYVTESEGPIILGLPDCQKMGVVSINHEINLKKSHRIKETTPIADRPPIGNKEDLIKMYPECFDDTIEGSSNAENIYQALLACLETHGVSVNKGGSLHSYFARSAKRSDALKGVQHALEEPVLKMLDLHRVRWLSFGNCIVNIRRSLRALYDMLRREAEEDAQATGLYNELRNYKFVFAVSVLEDVFGQLNMMSKVFQTKGLDFSQVKPTVNAVIDSLSDMAAGHHGPSLTRFLQAELADLYPGVDITHNDQQTKAAAENLKRNFIQNVVQNLQDRFPQTELIGAFKIMNPRELPNEENNLQEYGEEELETLLRVYGRPNLPFKMQEIAF